MEFEKGFLKEAQEAGCDITFLKGYIKEADEIVEIWKQAFDELAEASGDPLYRYKLANEIIYAGELLKKAENEIHPNATAYPPDNTPGPSEPFMNLLGRTTGMDGWQQGLQGWASKNQGDGKGILGFLVQAMQKNPHLLTSLLSGGAGGGLLGLLFGGAMGSPGLGLMGGALAGATGSAYLNNQGIQDSVSNWGNPKPDSAASDASAPKPAGTDTAAPTTPVPPKPNPVPVNPTPTNAPGTPGVIPPKPNPVPVNPMPPAPGLKLTGK